MINLSSNILRLRQQKKITQDQLADFLNVTKSSVSKWENGQSSPDLELLSRIAIYFDVSLDYLVGYEATLTKAQIKNIYLKFSSRFANEDFDIVLNDIYKYIDRYYSCYEFLEQMILLLINHASLTNEANRYPIYNKSYELCERIISNCSNEFLRSNTYYLRSIIDLNLGHPENVIQQLEDVLSPLSLANGSFVLLSQAYQMTNDKDKMNQLLQYTMYSSLSNLLISSTQYLIKQVMNHEDFNETILRIDHLIDLYHLSEVNPNSVAQYEFSVAMFSTEKSEKIRRLQLFSKYSLLILKTEKLSVNHDPYFDQIDTIIEQSNLGSSLVRDKKTIIQGIYEALRHPAFLELIEDPDFKKILDDIKECE